MTNESIKKLEQIIKTYLPNDFDIDAAIKALEQQPSEDCISRQAVIDYAKDTCADLDKDEDTEIFCDEIKAMSPATPQPKVGIWKRIKSLMEHISNVQNVTRN